MIKRILLIVSVFIVREKPLEVQIVISLLGVAVFAVTLRRISKKFWPALKVFCKSLASMILSTKKTTEELSTIIAKSTNERNSVEKYCVVENEEEWKMRKKKMVGFEVLLTLFYVLQNVVEDIIVWQVKCTEAANNT